MICAPALLPEVFAETPIPAGPISDEAAEAIARLLWDAAEDDSEHQRTTLGGMEEHSNG
ncbi:MAG: hypothetical protein WCB27_15620 [Thermoguttaceae bacterium]